MKLHHSNPAAVERRRTRAKNREQKDVLAQLIVAIAQAGVPLPKEVSQWAKDQDQAKEEE